MAITKTGASSYTATCDNCGTPIKNIFEVGDKIYGSECIKKMTGAKVDPRRAIWVENWQAYMDYKAKLQRFVDEDPLEY